MLLQTILSKTMANMEMVRNSSTISWPPSFTKSFKSSMTSSTTWSRSLTRKLKSLLAALMTTLASSLKELAGVVVGLFIVCLSRFPGFWFPGFSKPKNRWKPENNCADCRCLKIPFLGMLWYWLWNGHICDGTILQPSKSKIRFISADIGQWSQW